MTFRDVVKYSFFNMSHLKEEYKLYVGNDGPNKSVIRKFIKY
jgi:hypothetical protein